MRRRDATVIGSEEPRGRSADPALLRVGPLANVPALLRELRTRAEPLLDSVGLTPAQLDDPETRIPYVAGSRLLARCVAATGCEHFGLLLGQRAGSSFLGVPGFMLRFAPTVDAALGSLAAHLDLHDEGGLPTMSTSGGIALLGYTILERDAEAGAQIYDLCAAVACNIMRDLCGAQWCPREVLLTRRAPRDRKPYDRFFQAPLRFGAGQCAIAFPAQVLQQPLPGADPLLYRHFEREVHALRQGRGSALISALRRVLHAILASGTCSIAAAAQQLSMHERTLERRLRSEATSFQRERDNVRYTMAKQLLTDSSMTVAQIASMLEYADSSAFSRAFKRWAGTPPMRWRHAGGADRGAQA